MRQSETLKPRSVAYTHHGRPWTLNAERSGGGGQSHGHWSKTRKITAEWREAFWVLGVRNRVQFRTAYIVVQIFQKSPLADTGNAYGSIKAAIDGLVDAGVLPGDGPGVVLSITMLAPQKVISRQDETVTLIVYDGDYYRGIRVVAE
jgi:hypothetical protein